MIARLSVLSVFLIAALIIAGYVVGGRPQSVHETARDIYALASDGEALYWLEADRSPDAPPGAGSNVAAGALYRMARGAKSPDCLYPEQTLSEFVPAGDHVLAIEMGETSNALLSVPVKGGAPVCLAENLRRPSGLLEAEGKVYWTETYAPKLEHVHHIPAAGSLTAIRSCPTSGRGEVRTEGTLTGEPGGLSGKLLGVQPDSSDLLLLDHFGGRWGGGWSAVRVISPPHGAVRTSVLVRGTINDALLDGTDLYWTAPSEDAGRPMMFRCVRRAPAPGSGEYETLTDWLPSFGKLARLNGRTLYRAYGDVWLVPDRLGRPVTVARTRGDAKALATLGGRLYTTSSTAAGEALCWVPQSVLQRLLAAGGMG